MDSSFLPDLFLRRLPYIREVNKQKEDSRERQKHFEFFIPLCFSCRQVKKTDTGNEKRGREQRDRPSMAANLLR